MNIYDINSETNKNNTEISASSVSSVSRQDNKEYHSNIKVTEVVNVIIKENPIFDPTTQITFNIVDNYKMNEVSTDEEEEVVEIESSDEDIEESDERTHTLHPLLSFSLVYSIVHIIFDLIIDDFVKLSQGLIFISSILLTMYHSKAVIIIYMFYFVIAVFLCMADIFAVFSLMGFMMLSVCYIAIIADEAKKQQSFKRIKIKPKSTCFDYWERNPYALVLILMAFFYFLMMLTGGYFMIHMVIHIVYGVMFLCDKKGYLYIVQIFFLPVVVFYMYPFNEDLHIPYNILIVAFVVLTVLAGYRVDRYSR